MIREAQAEFDHYKNISIDDVHHWIWLYWDLFSVWTNKEHLLGTMVLVIQLVTTSLVYIQLCLHFLFQQRTISHWIITWGNVTVSDVIKMPTIGQKQQTKQKETLPFIHLGMWTSFSYISLNSTVSNKVPTQALLRTFAFWAMEPTGKIQSYFISFIQSRSLAPEFLCTVRQSRTWRNEHAADEVVIWWRGLWTTAVNSFLPSDPPWSCCQHRLQIMTSELTDVYTGWF